jgi:hypothetical protein
MKTSLEIVFGRTTMSSMHDSGDNFLYQQIVITSLGDWLLQDCTDPDSKFHFSPIDEIVDRTKTTRPDNLDPNL